MRSIRSREPWKTSLVRYFAKGCKKDGGQRLGLEVEHFVLRRKDGTAVPYDGDDGIRHLLTVLMACYPDAEVLPEEAFLGFQTELFSVTLEPAAQLEISIAPMCAIRRIEDVYREFADTVRRLLPEDQCLAHCGTQPVSRVDDLSLIPKQRYALMDAYFQKTGTGGRQMMRGTASVQVSVDYTSEEDFRRKIQAAYYYGPVLKLLCDNAPRFQGADVHGHLLRTDIWNRVDPGRCGILPGIFSGGYGFESYASFIGALRPIFIKENGHIRPVGDATVAELYAGRALQEDEILHVLSMAFPDVRLKQFLEIRTADCVPAPYMAAYAALIKGIFCAAEGIRHAEEQITAQELTEEDIRRAERSLMQDGWNGRIYGCPARDAAERALGIAQRNLPAEEGRYMEHFREVLRAGGIPQLSETQRKEGSNESAERGF